MDYPYTCARRGMTWILSSQVSILRVQDAMVTAPRDLFVKPALANRAYDDSALSIGEGQAITNPLMVGLLL
jgi:protein-L-isoaspartate O-methyltransferase